MGIERSALSLFASKILNAAKTHIGHSFKWHSIFSIECISLPCYTSKYFISSKKPKNT